MAEFEVDFISLSFARTADDVMQAREFLDSVGLTTTKARPSPSLSPATQEHGHVITGLQQDLWCMFIHLLLTV